MPDEVQITNVAPGIRIPVVVENRPDEPIPVTAPNNLPVEVRNSPEIRGTVSLASDATLQLRPPAFLVAGRRYNITGLIGLPTGNPITLLSLDGYPWISVQPPPLGTVPPQSVPPIFINLGLVASIQEV
jgi:hypothetical protein